MITDEQKEMLLDIGKECEFMFDNLYKGCYAYYSKDKYKGKMVSVSGGEATHEAAYGLRLSLIEGLFSLIDDDMKNIEIDETETEIAITYMPW